MCFRHVQNKTGVQGFDASHIDDGSVQGLSRLKRSTKHCAERKQGNPLSFPTDLGFPDRNGAHHCGFAHSGSGSAWVSDGGRPFVQESAVKHVPTFRLI